MAEMKGIMIFDEMNDVLFSKFDENFDKHLRKLAVEQGFLPEESNEDLTNDMLIQIFSPIITSQRIMSTQFGNSYRCIQCEDGLNIVFNEYLGYLFFVASRESTEALHRLSGVCVTMVKHLCAGDLSLFKSRPRRMAALLSRLLDRWSRLYRTEQSFLLDCTEQLLVNREVGVAAQRALKEAAENASNCSGATSGGGGHALMFVGSKFLSLYSSVNSCPLTSGDLLFLNLFGQLVTSSSSADDDDAGGEERRHREKEVDDRDEASTTAAEQEEEEERGLRLASHRLFLNVSASSKPHCLPHSVHCLRLEPPSPSASAVTLVLIAETNHSGAASPLHEAFLSLNLLKLCLQQREMDLLRPAFENLDCALRRISEALRKNAKNSSSRNIGGGSSAQLVENQHRNLQNKWDMVKRKYADYFKTQDQHCLVSVDSLMSVLWEALRLLFHATCMPATATGTAVAGGAATDAREEVDGRADGCTLSLSNKDKTRILDVAAKVRSRMSAFAEFLRVKSLRNFTLGSYLEEFPGLVHFLHADRTRNRLTAPTLAEVTGTDDDKDGGCGGEMAALIKEKVWRMVERSRRYLSRGHTSAAWRDSAFSYAWFLWYEDAATGAPVRPTACGQRTAGGGGGGGGDKNRDGAGGGGGKDSRGAAAEWQQLVPLPEPGVLCGDFYQKLLAADFPNNNNSGDSRHPQQRGHQPHSQPSGAGAVRCRELFCVHLGLVTSGCALEHARRLAATVWEVSGAPTDPLDLL